MTLSSAEQTAYRQLLQQLRAHLVVVVPPDIWQCSVNGAHSQGAMSITFDAGAAIGSYVVGDVSEHFTATVYEGGVKKARVRYKSGAAVGTGTLVLDKNDIEWADDDVIKIEFEVRPWAITPDLTNTYEDENKAYTDQNTKMHPLVWIGPPAFAFLESSYVDVEFWSDAEIDHIGTGSIGSTTWTFYNGTVTNPGAAGTAVDPFIVRYTTTGNHPVKCVKTHTNGASGVRYGWALIRSRSATPILFKSLSIQGTLDGMGGRMSAELYDADSLTLPDGAMLVLATEAYYNNVQVDYGGNWTHRENIRFVGWMDEGTVNQEPLTGTVSFDVVHPSYLDLACWPADLHDEGTTEWHMIPFLDWPKALFHLLSEHSTIPECCDVHLPDNDKILKYVDIAEANLWDQLKSQIGEAFGSVLAFDQQGALYIETNVQLLSETDRSAIDVMFTAASTDWLNFRLGSEKPREQEAQNDFVGFDYDTDDNPEPFYSLAPSRQYSFGKIGRTRGVRVDDQDESNTLSGIYNAYANAQYLNNSIQMAGHWFCFDVVPQRYFNFPLTGTETERGIIWTGDSARQLPVGYRYGWNEQGYFDVEIEFAKDSLGPPGQTGEQPEVTPAPPEPPPSTPPWIPPSVEGTVVLVGTFGAQKRSGAGVCFCLNAADAADGDDPEWTETNFGFPITKPAIMDLAVDPQNPATRAVCIARTDYVSPLVYDAAVWINNDWSGSGSWSKVLSTSEATALVNAKIGYTGIDWLNINQVATVQIGGTTYISVVVRYRAPSESGDTYDFNRYTRCLVSSNWGQSWTVGDRPECRRSGGNPSYGLSLRGFIPEVNTDAGTPGTGEIIAYDGNLYAAGKAPGGSSQGRGNVVKSADAGLTWSILGAASLGDSSSSNSGNSVRALSTGLLLTHFRVNAPNPAPPPTSFEYFANYKAAWADLDGSWAPEKVGGLAAAFQSMKTYLWSDEITWYGGKKLMVTTRSDDDKDIVLKVALKEYDPYTGLDLDPHTEVHGPNGTTVVAYPFAVIELHPTTGSQVCLLAFGEIELSTDAEQMIWYSDDYGSTFYNANGSGATGLYEMGARGLSRLLILDIPAS